jgi:predicted component of type VI protein secretion system
MDDLQTPNANAQDVKLPRSGPEPFQGPHWSHHDTEPANFLPLRLSLQPEGPSVELTRPEMLVGRHSVADVRLRSAEVSRRHCRFVFAEGQWQVFDLSSLNGVWVNGMRVERAVLQNKDVIHIGCYDFEVEIGPSTIPIPGPAAPNAANAMTQGPGRTSARRSPPNTEILDSSEPHKKAS